MHFLLADSTVGLIALLGISFFGMRMAGPANMWLSSIFLAGVVVVLLSLAGIPAHTTVLDRSVDTAVGGAVALAAALLWPSWERRQVPDRLAELLGAYRGYLKALVEPDTSANQRAAARSAARLARSAAEASIERTRVEPVDALGVVDLGGAVLAHSHRLVHALTAIDATRQAREVYQKVPEFRFFVDAVERGLALAQQSVQYGWRPGRELRLRDLHGRLEPALRRAELPDALTAALVEAGDRLVDSLNSVLAVLSEQARDRTAVALAGDPDSRR